MGGRDAVVSLPSNHRGRYVTRQAKLDLISPGCVGPLSPRVLAVYFVFISTVQRNLGPQISKLCVCVCVCARAHCVSVCMCIHMCVCGGGGGVRARVNYSWAIPTMPRWLTSLKYIWINTDRDRGSSIPTLKS